MAFLSTRLINRSVKNNFALISRLYADYKEVPEALELATGLEREQLLQKMKGNDDPFKMKTIKRQASTKTNPNIIPSYYDCRIVGCVCEEDSSNVVWMWLFKGEPKRCMCGHWFKLEKYRPS